MPNGSKWYDNTLRAEGKTEKDVIAFFEAQKDIERWCFEFEVGDTETAYEHYQIRYVLKTKGTWENEIIRWRDYGWQDGHVTVLGMKHPDWEYV